MKFILCYLHDNVLTCKFDFSVLNIFDDYFLVLKIHSSRKSHRIIENLIFSTKEYIREKWQSI